MKSVNLDTKPHMWCVWGILSIILFGCFPLSPWGEQIPHGDQTIYIAISKWMNEGMVMYRDMFDHKGLAIYWFNQLGLRCGGLTGIWILTCIWMWFTAWLSYKICRLFAREVASFIASILFILITTRTSSNDSPEMVSMPFVTAGYYVLLKAWYANRIPDFWQSFVATFGFGIICLLKPNIGAGIAILILMHLVRMCQQKEAHAAAYCLAGGIVGFLLPIGYALIYIISNGAWEAYLTTFWQFNMEYSASYTWTQRLATVWKLGVCYPPTAIMWIFFMVIVPVMIRRGESKLLWPVLLCHLCLFVFDLNMSGWPSGLYLLPLFPIYMIYVARFFDWATGKMKLFGLAVIGVYACYIGFRSTLEYLGRDPWWPKDTECVALTQFIEQHTAPEDKVVLYHCSVAPYIFTSRHSPTKFLYQSPLFEIRPSLRKEFIADLYNEQPKLIVMPTTAWGSFPMELMENYQEVKGTVAHKRFFIHK